jgi:hypothetical protein
LPKESKKERPQDFQGEGTRGSVAGNTRMENPQRGLPAAGDQNTHLIIAEVLIFYTPKRMGELQSI